MSADEMGVAMEQFLQQQKAATGADSSSPAAMNEIDEIVMPATWKPTNLLASSWRCYSVEGGWVSQWPLTVVCEP